MSGNETNFTTEIPYYSYADIDHNRIWRARITFVVVEIFLAVAGTLVSLWFLAAILTSAEMRSRLRNKIMCNACVVHLLNSALLTPVLLGSLMNSGVGNNCSYNSAFTNLVLMLDFISNWLVVILIAVFIAQIQDFNPATRLTWKATTLCIVGLMLMPWLASVLFVPVVYFSLSSAIDGCHYTTQYSQAIFRSVDTALPVILAILLVITAAGLRYRRYTRGHSSGSMRPELISRGPEVDTIFAYVAAVVVSSVCDILMLIFSLEFSLIYSQNPIVRMELIIATFILSDVRVILMPLAWLFLPDIRQRIKTWRPWRRSTYGVNLTVTYVREVD